MMPLAYRVAQRFLILSDDRYRPPRHILDGVDKGELDPKVLLVWKYVVEKLGPKFSYGAGVAYWKSKCAKEGLDLPLQFVKAEQGAEFGHFKIKTGDQIEDWVKERLKSAGLISDTQKTAEEWQFEISSLDAAVQDAQERIAKHEKGLAEGTRVNQRIKWLAEAKTDLEKAGKDLELARKAVEELQKVLVKHVDVEAPAIDFEKQFQTALHLASNDLSKREVLIKARAALAKFEAEMMNPKMAGVMDSLMGGLQKAWGMVQSAFSVLKSWVTDLVQDTKNLDKLLQSV